MSFRQVLGYLLIAILVYWIVTKPIEAGTFINHLFAGLAKFAGSL